MKSAIVAVGMAVLAGCATQTSTKPVEFLDERTALTVGALHEPIEMVPGTRSTSMNPLRLVGRQHVSFAYLGPVEWDRSGTILYGLWVHVAPGSGLQLADIHAPHALILHLDDEAVELKPMDAPTLGRPPYEPIASWGQTAYFALDAATLRRMAAATRLTLDVQSENSTVNFSSAADTRAVLSEFIQARGGLTGD